VKTPAQVVADVGRRLTRTWAVEVTAEVNPAAPRPATVPVPAWPHDFPLGEPASSVLAKDFAAVVTEVSAWRAWADDRGLALRFRDRRVLGTAQVLPTHVQVPDLDTAARLCGPPWLQRLVQARGRASVLAHRYPHLVEPARTLAAAVPLGDVDFDLACRAGDWFAGHDASGLTPRQVPIEGLHAKWLNTRRALVRELAGVEDLRLLPDHPARIHFTYLDPSYRASRGRVHDSATVGDPVVLPYRPQVVVISENKDTAIHFPELAGGVSVEGVGRGGRTAAAFSWIATAPAVLYWGDMDVDGLEILDGFRAAGVPATSVLMSCAAFDTWGRFGTNVDQRGRPLESRPPRPVPHLTPDESALYHRLISPGWAGHRRVEQERIPLAVAGAEVRRLLGLGNGEEG
jgi:hypothetical protein